MQLRWHGMKFKLPVLFLAAMVILALSPGPVQALASLNGNYINIWSDAANNIRNEENCSTLLLDLPANIISACPAATSGFAGVCIYVNGTINVTRAGANNLTNFSIRGCEMRFNETVNKPTRNNITSSGNLTIDYSNITTNSTATAVIPMYILANRFSNLTISNSFISYCGSTATVKPCLDIRSQANITNSTFTTLDGSIQFFDGYSNGTTVDGLREFPLTTSVIPAFSFLNTNAYSQNISLKNIYINSHGSGNGFDIKHAANVTMVNVTVENNGGVGGSGLSIYDVKNTSVLNSTFIDSTLAAGLSGEVYYKNCEFKSVAQNYQLMRLDAANVAGFSQVFEDCNMSSVQAIPIGGSIDLANTARNIIFRNSTFYRVFENVGVGSSSALQRQWYTMIKITTGASIPVKNNITVIFSNQSFLNYSYTTNDTGWISQFNMTSYINESGTVLNFTSYRLDIVSQADVNFTLLFNNENHVGTEYENLLLSGTIGNMNFIAPTYPVWTNTTNTTAFVNVSVYTSGVSLSKCVAEWCNFTGCANYTVPSFLTSSYYYCGLEVNQSASGWFSVKFFANDTGGVVANTSTLNITKDIDAPIVGSFYSLPACMEIPRIVNFSWVQTDYETMINGSTSCNFTDPGGNTYNMTSGISNTTGNCSLEINTTAANQWNLTVYAWDMANNEANATYQFSPFLAGGCSPVPPGGGGSPSLPEAPAGACNVTYYPSRGFSGGASLGGVIAPFKVVIYNRNVSQTFTAEIQGDVKDYCTIAYEMVAPTAPFGQKQFTINCVAPENVTNGNLVVMSNLATNGRLCQFAIPLAVGPSPDILADLSNTFKLIAAGDFNGFMASTIIGVPSWLFLLILVALMVGMPWILLSD
jgi:hypothetical protein